MTWFKPGAYGVSSNHSYCQTGSFFLKKYGPIPDFILFILALFTSQLNYKLKDIWCAWDSILGPQIGGRRRIHWAMVAALKAFILSFSHLFQFQPLSQNQFLFLRLSQNLSLMTILAFSPSIYFTPSYLPFSYWRVTRNFIMLEWNKGQIQKVKFSVRFHLKSLEQDEQKQLK